MKCPKCLIQNEETEELCRICGAKLHLICPECGASVHSSDKFCNECGYELDIKDRQLETEAKIASGRKHVTVLFADFCGYTALAERLDPEELKDIMSPLFGEITKVILKFEGFIDKFIGDAVMALFGLPWTHEDDPLRAVKAANEIHHEVGKLSQKFQERIGVPLAMHIGINSGLVVTGEIHLEDGTHHVAGDTVNIASRLCSMARAGETLVGHATYSQAEGFYSFERLEPVLVRGRTKPVRVYKLLASKAMPSKTHRISGVRADFIGRQAEMAELKEAAAKLADGVGSVISISGEAGTGKSRLIEEFKSSLDLTSIQWFEGHAYAYTQDIPYYPLIDLLNRMFQLKESDPPEITKKKVGTMIRDLLGDGEEVLPYLGGVLSLPSLGPGEINPDFWKIRLREAVLTFLSALVRRKPTIISLEDLHWADPSFLELLRFLLGTSSHPTLFLCAYRPPLKLISKEQLNHMLESYREVILKDLSPTETQMMVGSLLKTETVPLGLQQVIKQKIGGNPFYVEEVVNSLIESGILDHHQGDWQFLDTHQQMIVPATIKGVIMARLDRLDESTKEILQEASVIGRTFYHEILESITAVSTPLYQYMRKLRKLDLIRVGSTHPDIEYSFKHALIQEAVYDGLLKKQRKEIHERVGLALEQFFKERSLEAWETLAFHFKKGLSVTKAVDYLIKSGEKSLDRYALEEAHQYFREAFDLLFHSPARTKKEDLLLIDLLMKWCLPYYYQGRFRDMTDLLLAHVDLAESLEDKARLGAYYFWLGHSTFWQGAKLQDSYWYLSKALELGEKTGDQKVIAYACGFLIKTCAELGNIEEASLYERRTQDMMELFPTDAFLHMTFYSGKGWIGWFSGDKDKLYQGAKGLLDYGREKSSLRCQMVGYLLMGVRHFMDLDMEPAVECVKKVIDRGDPYHRQFGKLLMGMFLVHMRQFETAADYLTQVIDYSEEERTEYLKRYAHMFLGTALAALGNLQAGICLVESASQEFLEFQRNVLRSLSESILGSIYLQIFQGSGNKRLPLVFKNLGFILKNILFVSRKSEKHLAEAIQLARETGALGFLGQPCLQMGLLMKLKGQKGKAREYLSEAIHIFEECDFQVYLQRAQELQASLQ
jgi:class 3 adenylate cyclase/tetratricopeptide (TPR) repeat protein